MSDMGQAPENAISADTSIELEDGQWSVFVNVFFEHEIVRKRIATYRTKALAEIAASAIARAANRQI